MFSLTRLEDDDFGYLDQVRRIFAGCLTQDQPAEFYVTRIRHWFDYKWCYFTGKVVGTLGMSRFRDLTLPPFVPNRILSQEHYDRVGIDGTSYQRSDASPLHIHQPSEANFRRLIRRFTNDGTMLWFSSGSKAAGRGSMMVYHVSPEIKFGWHVTFLKKSEWQIDKVTFTSKSLVERLRETGSVGGEYSR